MKKGSLSLRSLRQCTAKIVSCAVCDLYPDAQIVESDANDSGFYCDFIFKRIPGHEIILQLEERLRMLVTAQIPIGTLTMMRHNAVELFRHQGQNIKANFLTRSSEQFVDILQMDEFYDECPQPHISSSKEIAAFKIQSFDPEVAISSPIGELIVSRITGTAFSDKGELKQFLKLAETAKEYDHRFLGQELDLFGLQEKGANGCLWYPRGMILREWLHDWWKKQMQDRGFSRVSTPHLVELSLLEKSGIDKKKDGFSELFPSFSVGSVVSCLRPSFTLQHVLLFIKEKITSLPVRYAEWGEVYREDKESRLHGMLRNRIYTQDSSHIFCTKDHVLEEVISSLHFIAQIIRMFDFKPIWYLRSRFTRKSNAEVWNRSTECLIQALKACGFDYTDHVEDALVGPQVIMCVADALGREWEISSLGIDLVLPKRLGLKFETKSDSITPTVITLSGFNSVERLVGLVTEKYRGEFPFWLVPEQVRVISLGKSQWAEAQNVQKALEKNGFRATLAPLEESTLSEKIAIAERHRVPYVIIIGEQEQREGLVNVRTFPERKTHKRKLDEVISLLKEENVIPLES